MKHLVLNLHPVGGARQMKRQGPTGKRMNGVFLPV